MLRSDFLAAKDKSVLNKFAATIFCEKMRVTYDKEADAMYVYFEEPRAGAAKHTVALNDDIIVDFDKDKKIIGIEILSV